MGGLLVPSDKRNDPFIAEPSGSRPEMVGGHPAGVINERVLEHRQSIWAGANHCDRHCDARDSNREKAPHPQPIELPAHL